MLGDPNPQREKIVAFTRVYPVYQVFITYAMPLDWLPIDKTRGRSGPLGLPSEYRSFGASKPRVTESRRDEYPIKC